MIAQIPAGVVVIVVVVPALLMLMHWLPWAWFTGRRLPPRVLSYAAGVLAVIVPVSLVVIFSDAPLSDLQALLLVWLGFVSAGIVTVVNHMMREIMLRTDRRMVEAATLEQRPAEEFDG